MISETYETNDFPRFLLEMIGYIRGLSGLSDPNAQKNRYDHHGTDFHLVIDGNSKTIEIQEDSKESLARRIEKIEKETNIKLIKKIK